MQKLGKYTIVDKIGVGGFGVVYKGHDPFIKRHVAIKTCSVEDTETRERFHREAEISGNLQHRNIVTVYEFGIDEGTPYLVQEYLSGEDLDRKIKRNEFIPLPEKILWLVQIARGLEFAHERGIIHRDIKPANIRILDDGTAKILDFGIAKLAHQTSHLTQAGIALGTAAYLAPEQIRGQAVDMRTDVFSFGVLAYELLAFERPFRAAEISALFYKTLHEDPEPLAPRVADLPIELERVIRKCLEKDPARRFSPTGELVRALERFMQRSAAPGGTLIGARLHPGSGPTAAPGDAPTPTAATVRRGIDHVEFRHAEAGPRVQSRSMATTAFGAGRPRSWGRWAAMLAGAAVLAAVAIFFGRAASSRPAEPEPTAAIPAAAPEQPTAVAPAGPAPGPATTDTAPAPAEVEPAPPADPAPPPEAEPEPPPAPPGRVIVPAAWNPAMQVRVGGRRYRLDTEQRISLPPGTHTLQFSIDTPAYRFEKSAQVRVSSDSTTRVELPIAAPGQLTVQPHLQTRPGTVRIDGTTVGPAPLRHRWLAPGDHFLEVFATDAAAASISQTVTVRSGAETVVTFDVDGHQPLQIRERPVVGE